MAPVDRVEVRQAIAHAIDRARLVRESPLLRREAVGILPPGMLAYSPDPKALSHDPDRARLLLRRAGFDAERPVEPLVLYTTATSATARKLIESIGRDLGEIGIDLDVREVPWSELTSLIESRRAPAFLLGWVADMNDPDAFLRGVLDVDGSGNSFGFEDPVAAKMLEDGLRELSPVERTRIYRRIESRVLSQAPLVPLYHTLGVVASRRTVHGFEPGPMGIANLEFEKIWIEDGAVAMARGVRE
jgi:ABC-type transport system substrate-binding protein